MLGSGLGLGLGSVVVVVLSVLMLCYPLLMLCLCKAVIAHELGHLKCEHGVWLLIANLFSLGATRLLPIPILVDSIEDAIMRWARSAELTCDRS